MTLLELLLALLVVVGLTLTAVYIYGVARNNAQASVAEHRVTLIVNASYKWLGLNSQVDFCNADWRDKCTNPVTMQKLLDAGLISNVDSQNPWTALPITVMPHPVIRKYIQIRLDNIPRSACVSLGEKLYEVALAAGILVDGHPYCGCLGGTTMICVLG